MSVIEGGMEERRDNARQVAIQRVAHLDEDADEDKKEHRSLSRS